MKWPTKGLYFAHLPFILGSISTSVCILQNCDISITEFQSKLYNFKYCFSGCRHVHHKVTTKILPIAFLTGYSNNSQ